MAQLINLERSGDHRFDLFRRLKSKAGDDLAGGIRYVATQRHKIEVEHYAYRKALLRLIRKFSN